MSTDRNLLFGVLALQADLLTPAQFAQACSAWTAAKDTPLADLLVERGWLTPGDRADVDKLLQRKLNKHQGDARASLAEVTTDPVRQSLAGLNDPDVRQSLAGPTPPPQGHVLLATTDFSPEVRDRYTLSRLHATGGIGRVWLARDASLGRDIALKELRPERAGQPALWGRFLREAQITGQLEHPGIVPVYEIGRRPDDQAPFYTMRFVRGRTLAEAARAYHDRRGRGEAGPLELRELLTAFVGVCNAVAYAHSRGVLHRDLKPQNVVLGDYGEVIVLDWGLAKVMGEAEGDAVPVAPDAEGSAEGGTVAGQVLGTPAYMAPEQAEGRLDLLDARTDVYGLGAILYELLAGQPPFTGQETEAVLRQVVHEAPRPPRATVPGLPRALEAVCLKALAKRPGERYASAKDLVEDVKHFLADEPVTAYREPLPARAGRWARRHRTLVWAATVALLAALGGLGAVLAVQRRANADLAAKNAELADEQAKVQARFELAQKAIETFHTGVSEDVLLKQDQFKELRDKLLKEAAGFYGELQKLLEGQTDARSRRALGSGYFQLATLTAKIGSIPEARVVHRKALAVRRELAAAAGADVEARLDVARSLWAEGRLLERMGDLPGARAAFEEMRELAERLTAEGPANAVRAVLAQSHHNLGLLLERTGKRAEALAAYEKALTIRQKLADANPAVTDFQSDLAWTHENIGIQLQWTGKPKEVLAAWAKALAIRQKLADAYPAVTRFQSELAVSQDIIGIDLSQTGKPAEGLAACAQARAIRQKLADAYPALTLFQTDLAQSYGGNGWLLERMGKNAEALELHQKALAISQKLADANPAVIEFQTGLASIHISIGSLLVKTGKPAEGLAVFRKGMAIRQKLADAHPAVILFQTELAAAHVHRGYLLSRSGKKPAEQLAAYQKALAIRQKLADAHHSDTQVEIALADSYGDIGTLLGEMGKPVEALAAYEQARTILQKGADSHPSDIGLQGALARIAYNIGRLHASQRRYADAFAALDRALDRSQKLAAEHPDFLPNARQLGLSHAYRGWARARAGQPAGAAADLRRAAEFLAKERGATVFDIRFERGRALALLAGLGGDAKSGATAVEAAAFADQAVAALRDAVTAGWMRTDELKEPDFDPLRGREDFKKLFADLEARFGPREEQQN